ncbi:hypothetical protein OS493_008959 [Desmophyllum pertusum]|uniref:NUP160 helical domain-containing protein n=1 Tax=Desmophyllum pertusum TaxID=174260 RepID=A0A9W9ZF80_9CNID|nr:hypothetical protein OS493_008959 [Desmophyllum pertusum]
MDPHALFEFVQELETSLHKIRNIFECLDFLFQGLDHQGDIKDDEETDWSDVSRMMSCHHLFSSHLSTMLLSLSSRQMVSSCMSVCKHLLVLFSLMRRLSVNKIGLDVRGSR